MNTHIARAAAMAIATAALTGAGLLGTAIAHADPATINLTEIADEIDAIPACTLEDGSDVIPATAGRCLWFDPSIKGDVWLTYADRSYLIVDDTAR